MKGILEVNFLIITFMNNTISTKLTIEQALYLLKQ